MENSKKIILFYIFISLLSCQKEKYKHIKYNLYEDNAKNIYVKQIAENFDDNTKILINYDSLVYNSKTEKIIELKNIVDITTYQPNKNYTGYQDKNNLYVFSDKPIYFPYLSIIDIKKRYKTFSSYISDGSKVYYFSKEINADAQSFNIIQLKDTVNNQNDIFGVDKYHVFRNDEFLSCENFMQLRITKKIKDSLKKIYFP